MEIKGSACPKYRMSDKAAGAVLKRYHQGRRLAVDFV